jgi:hypothetical protein
MGIRKQSAVAFAVLGLSVVPTAVVASSAGNDEPAGAGEIAPGTLISPANDKEAHVPIWFTLRVG